MRRIIVLAVVAFAALAVSGLAVAKLKPSGTESVAATFTAAKERATTRVCSGPDGEYEITHGRYVGTATATAGSDEAKAALTGPAHFHVKAVYNKTKGLGWIEGWLKVKREGDDDRRSKARLWATLGGDGAVEGLVHGRVGARYAVLFGNLSGRFDGSTLSGSLGTGSGANLAVLAGRPCGGKTGIAVRLSVVGEIEALSASEIKVKPRDGSGSQSCAIADRSPATGRFAVGDKVAIRCGLVGSTMTLVRIGKKD